MSEDALAVTDQEKADEREGEELTQAIRRRLEDISRYNFLTELHWNYVGSR